MFNQLYGQTLSMKGRILGFPELNDFVLQPVDEDNLSAPFAYLQSLEEDELGFLVTNPFYFYKSYELELSEEMKREIGAAKPEEVAVLAIVTIASPFESSTINLLAPLVINLPEQTGLQLVLPPDSAYTTKVPLVAMAVSEGGDR